MRRLTASLIQMFKANQTYFWRNFPSEVKPSCGCLWISFFAVSFSCRFLAFQSIETSPQIILIRLRASFGSYCFVCVRKRFKNASVLEQNENLTSAPTKFAFPDDQTSSSTPHESKEPFACDCELQRFSQRLETRRKLIVRRLNQVPDGQETQGIVLLFRPTLESSIYQF